MNFSLSRASLIAEADLVGIAGERAVCDRRGGLYFPDLRLLAVSDLHLEKGSSFARRGTLIPPYDTSATLLQLQAVIADYQPRIVVSLGDSFHDGGGAGRMHQSFRDRLEAMMAGRDWFWVAGNHDPDAPADLPGETVKELAIGALLFRHEPSKQRVEGEIAGHLHPCARIVQRGRSVRRRCFAGDGGRMIMPAFGAYTGSLNVLDRAYAGLFRLETLVAYMLGAQRIFAISGSMLRPG
ncbi:ligase-associated DNA damage response endonuclease PdeM [Mesorhizobium sp. M3A.F.Ca.ET.174.01.1.1]|uniref:ligase-associated DNA damage response endonuclease PdeM n=1 Tax=unclassified Mesorhizobium TaxID=325217 RepID=UPI000F74C977|nr:MULTISPECIES: ligase-associated DNA damage response endonuclease PdeM [unclassified Mesorhizobium]TGT53864.1 ligase-associated DNA damage response endonuclease PdeM [Mesorhizobium sp. M00.F.Ca.ET.170.01.1.1]AZO09859.1 ligase-associated DNA damage response endonuclease PdeM [Mesorhizobium sp. M3A.F.Ca.ET.080.04.2.1]RWE20155.1 MAG: ligase-associated DNA damage response endonuclease PdeM [Mesorhizobium sp.]RWE29381.1 MAG: ligase-associated DNA damage response endonuclease PdeM [Mesorhizobium sp